MASESEKTNIWDVRALLNERDALTAKVWQLETEREQQEVECEIVQLSFDLLKARIDEIAAALERGENPPLVASFVEFRRLHAALDKLLARQQQRGDPSNDPKNPCYGSAAVRGAETVSSREGGRAAALEKTLAGESDRVIAEHHSCCNELESLRSQLAAANERIAELENNVYDHQPTYDALNELFNSVGTAEEQRACGRSVKERCEFIRKRATLQPLPEGAELFVPSGGGLTTNGEFHPFLRKVDPATFGIPGALIVAELERIERAEIAAESAQEKGGGDAGSYNEKWKEHWPAVMEGRNEEFVKPARKDGSKIQRMLDAIDAIDFLIAAQSQEKGKG